MMIDFRNKPKDVAREYLVRALCHTCYTSGVPCHAHPKTGMPECENCKTKREAAK